MNTSADGFKLKKIEKHVYMLDSAQAVDRGVGGSLHFPLPSTNMLNQITEKVKPSLQHLQQCCFGLSSGIPFFCILPRFHSAVVRAVIHSIF